METVIQGTVAAASAIMPDPDVWLSQLRDAVESILGSSYQCRPEVLRTALHLAIENDMAIDSEVLTAGEHRITSGSFVWGSDHLILFG